MPESFFSQFSDDQFEDVEDAYDMADAYEDTEAELMHTDEDKIEAEKEINTELGLDNSDENDNNIDNTTDSDISDFSDSLDDIDDEFDRCQNF